MQDNVSTPISQDLVLECAAVSIKVELQQNVFISHLCHCFEFEKFWNFGTSCHFLAPTGAQGVRMYVCSKSKTSG